MSDSEVETPAQGHAGVSGYTPHHPVPTVGKYKEVRQERREQESGDAPATEEPSKTDKVKSLLTTGSTDNAKGGGPPPYEGKNRNTREAISEDEESYGGASEHQDSQASRPDDTDDTDEPQQTDGSKDKRGGSKGRKSSKDSKTLGTSEGLETEQDPRKKRKAMKKRDPGGEREITDPVTHLPTKIHDFTQQELDNAPENLKKWNSESRTATGMEGAEKSDKDLDKEKKEIDDGFQGMQNLFPTPELEAVKDRIARTNTVGITAGFTAILAVIISTFGTSYMINGSDRNSTSSLVLNSIIFASGLGTCVLIAWGVNVYLARKISHVWDDQLWEASREKELKRLDAPVPESTMWLNSLLSSIWPLMNADLFNGVADMIEDVMQASLPGVVRMVAVEDIGQGSESIRLLGVRWLPGGAAAKTVSTDGKIQSGKSKDQNDRSVPGEGNIDRADQRDSKDVGSDKDKETGDKDQNPKEQEDINIAEGMEAEEGEFVNMELAFSYRASEDGKKKSLSKKTKNAHLLIMFYLPGSVGIPVWVSLQGIVGLLRVRLQLTPDPPFISLCTLTFLGQPKVDLSCMPLTKHLNLMDLPMISSFVQSSIDAAVAEYVAPKSLTLDLKEMMTGDDFKKNTNSRGVIIVRAKKAWDFKEGDGSLIPGKSGSADTYISLSWAKLGKPLWTTRIIMDDMKPAWDETAFVLVSPEEQNAEERLRIQLWDSDRTSADDNLGCIEMDLKDIMTNDRCKGKMWDREDGFMGFDANEKMPGTLSWEIGYYAKLKITKDQFQKQTADTEVRSMDQLKEKVHKQVKRKLREVSDRNIEDEARQQEAQDMAETENDLIASAPPPDGYNSGILSVQVHNITGLQVASLSKSRKENDDKDDDDDLPSSYCTVILNGQKVFKTRTKPKNSGPFFNASVERFIRDWKDAEVIVSIRDSRVHEDDPLLGIVHLPLEHVLRERSQSNQMYPISGGVGYGRIRISLAYRAVQLKAPKELMGWEYGTLELSKSAKSNDLPEELKKLKLKFRTSLGKGKMTSSEDGGWTTKKDRTIHLGVQKRYSSSMIVEFKGKGMVGGDKTSAFAILWLKDIPDDEEKTITLPVWNAKESSDLKRAEKNCLDDMGEKVGTIEFTLQFIAGLSDYHRGLAKSSKNVKDVMEVLDTAADNRDIKDDYDAEADSSDSSSSSDDDDRDEQEVDGKRGPMDQIKDYKDHHKTLHRQHRGVMQWKGARTANWLKNRVDSGMDTLKSSLTHKDRSPGIETEV